MRKTARRDIISAMRKRSDSRKTRRIALLAVMLALIVVLSFLPLNLGAAVLALTILPVLVVALTQDLLTSVAAGLLMGLTSCGLHRQRRHSHCADVPESAHIRFAARMRASRRVRRQGGAGGGAFRNRQRARAHPAFRKGLPGSRGFCFGSAGSRHQYRARSRNDMARLRRQTGGQRLCFARIRYGYGLPQFRYRGHSVSVAFAAYRLRGPQTGLRLPRSEKKGRAVRGNGCRQYGRLRLGCRFSARRFYERKNLRHRYGRRNFLRHKGRRSSRGTTPRQSRFRRQGRIAGGRFRAPFIFPRRNNRISIDKAHPRQYNQ